MGKMDVGKDVKSLEHGRELLKVRQANGKSELASVPVLVLKTARKTSDWALHADTEESKVEWEAQLRKAMGEAK